jgi:ribosomal protein L31
VCKVKSTFAAEEIKFLGHIVNSESIRPDPKKVEVVQNWPVPKNVHEVRSFLGLANYFRKFISHYSEVAAPLTNLTKKSHAWAWTGKCQDAFEKLKHLLTKAPLLRTPDESKTYRVVTDASDIGLGGVLLQEGHPIAYESRKLNSAEQNYTTTKREMPAVVHALRVWRCYLEGVYFEVETDHKCNTFFQSQPNLSRRQARWSEFLQRFGKFKWDYRPGKQNVADALSRRDVATSSQDSVSVVKALAVCAAAF